ncbi:MAG TPA: hypothetical protein VEY93_13650 [Longimicrobium sp.]|nr:hypothetical protein [Longimicrobium sp.]
MQQTVLVVITTGRPSYRQAAESLRLNIERWQPAVSRVDLLINFDITYQQTCETAFKEPPPPPLAPGGLVHFAGPDFIRTADWLEASERSALEFISPSTGYGQKKNACLLFAVRRSYDVVLFWDDDEYALHVERGNDGVRWTSSDVIGAHVQGRGDVTFGFWTGYVSPIPDSFFTEVDRTTRTILTDALGPITDVVEESTFFERAATYCIASARDRPAVEICETRGGKWISGGNLGLRRAAVIAGRLPAFYTPTDSRGDDSVFSTALGGAVVMQVPAGIFHDAFGALIDADLSRLGGLPIQPQVPGRTAERFARVLRGWIAYAPVLTALRGIDDVAGLIGESADRLSACDAPLTTYLGGAWRWLPPSALLRAYLAKVGPELDSFQRTQHVWQQLCGV